MSVLAVGRSRCATSYSTRASASENGRVQVAGVEQADAPGVEAVEAPDPGGGRELGGHGSLRQEVTLSGSGI